MKRKFKVFHIVYSFDSIGGLENGLINILNGCDSEYFDHVVCSLSKVGSLVERVTSKNVSYYSLNKKSGNDVFLPLKIAKLIYKERPDVVHLRNWPTMVEGYIAARICGVEKIIYSEHGRHFESVWNKQKLKTSVIKYILNHVDQCLCVSADVALEMKQLYQLNRPVDVILNGVDCNKFKPVATQVTCNSASKFIVGSVGRLDRGKQFDQLIQDFSDSNFDMDLIIVGDGPEFNDIFKIINSQNNASRIRLLGNIDNVNEVLQMFSVFALPSESEGLSNAIMEAMSCGLPVVAYDVGGNRELVKDGEGGFLIENNNRRDFMDKLILLFNDAELRRRMGNFNREFILNNFSISIMVRNYEKIYKV